ncbi:MAG: c-type cytochrome, partial [Pseudomonadota bacterium]
RPAAVFEDTRHSTRLDHADARGVIRSTAKLDGFAAEPYAVITGTRMSFRDIKNGDDHRNCIDNPRRCSASLQGVSRSDLTADPDPPVFEISDDREYGAYLASECITCHQVNGADYGIPSIKGWPRDEFIAAMQAYKTKARTHPVMQMMASRLSDEEIAVLAAYFEGAD